ncbi:hypothetical protein HMPREF1619_04643 [Klebsiella pneumoniae 909957]|nr:hypothetical protein HMPREF1619_04643 [Klebsiella pneumoniae 909957]
MDQPYKNQRPDGRAAADIVCFQPAVFTSPYAFATLSERLTGAARTLPKLRMKKRMRTILII